MKKINGKVYPMWSQFVEKKEQWIGGTLTDTGDPMDKRMGLESISTTITDIVLRENGKDSAYFEIIGEDFSCGGDVKFLGIGGGNEENAINFCGYGGHQFYIKVKSK